MGFDFSGLQQTADRVLHNADEAIGKLRDLVLAPAADIPIQYYDKNGNLVQTTRPNLNKVFQTTLANLNTAMSKTFYVDAINGNDGNDGSQAAPLATPNRAVEIMPTGSFVNIVLLSDTTLQRPLEVRNKIVRTVLNGFSITKPASVLSSGFVIRNAIFSIVDNKGGSVISEDTGSSKWWENNMFALYDNATLLIGDTIDTNTNLSLEIGTPWWLVSDGAHANVRLNLATLNLYGGQTVSNYLLNRGGVINYIRNAGTVATGITEPARGLNI